MQALGLDASHFLHPLANYGYSCLPRKTWPQAAFRALRRQARTAFVQSCLDLLIWWLWVITHPQGFLDLPQLPSLDMLSNPTSRILSDQRTKNVFHSLRNRGKQWWFLDFVLWTCLSTILVFWFHFCCCEKVPWAKATYERKGFISAQDSRLQSIIVGESRQEPHKASRVSHRER